MRRIQLHCSFSLGDIAVLTGAVRDIQLAHPGEFRIGVETSCPDVWRHNPYVSTLFGVEKIDCNEVAIDRQGAGGFHYVQAYLDLLNQNLGTSAPLTKVAGDIHLSAEERNWYSDIWTLCGREIPYWIICSGGKYDLPVKWWDHDRYQAVVDYFRGSIQFVQVGTWGNHHPKLKGAVDLRGRTSVRDLIHLVYNSSGVFCGVTSLMHLAAAVPTPDGQPRPAVIIGGGREPQRWEAYPEHEFIGTSSLVRCSPCWKDRYMVLPDGAQNNRGKARCINISNDLPRCMDLISVQEVIDRFEKLESEGRFRFLNISQGKHGRVAEKAAEKVNSFEVHNITLHNSVSKAEEFISRIKNYPGHRFTSRGIVLCGGGVRYFTNAWVCVRILRQHGCNLPIQIWHLGRHELDRKMESLVAPFGVECVNAREVMNRHPFRNPLGWELKSYALLHCPFREVMLLDSDNVAVRDPSFLFDEPEYVKRGAVFWPDLGRLGPKRPIWKLCGIPYQDEPEFETGQLLVNKDRCWKPLNLAFWYNDHSEFFYRYIHGDKETFHLAWRKLGQPYAMPPFPIHRLEGTMCQHDFEGRILFQHRNLAKWEFFRPNPPVPWFALEADCLHYIEELRAKWDGHINKRREVAKVSGFWCRTDTSDPDIFQSVVQQNEYQLPPVIPPAELVIDIGAHIGSFSFACFHRGCRNILAFEAHRENYALARDNLKGCSGMKLVQRAVLDRKTRVSSEPFPIEPHGEDTGGAAVIENGAAKTQSVCLDEILRQHRRVFILKLDCEGSEWPLLLHSRELYRVKWLCGEYHELANHPLCPEVKEPLTRQLLRKKLRAVFKYVRTVADPGNSRLGKFWASHEPLDEFCLTPCPD